MTKLILDLERVALEDDKEAVQALLEALHRLGGLHKDTLVKGMKAAQMSQLGRCDEWV